MKSISRIWKTAILWKYGLRRRLTDIRCEEGHPSDCLFSSGKGWRWATGGKHARNHEVWAFMDLQQKIYSMFLHIGYIFLSHCEGIRKFSLEVVPLKDEPCMLTVALSFVRQHKELLERNTNEIRMSTGITSAFNGPQGHVSARTMASVAPLEWGLQNIVQQFATIQLKFN